MNTSDLEYEAYRAAKNNDVNGLQNLFTDGGVATSIRPYNQSLLLHAAQNHALDAAIFLLKNGFDVNEADQKGYTALHGAVDNGDPAMAQLLLDKGANPNATDLKENTPLSKAVFHAKEDLSLIKILVAGGADPEFVFYEGMDAKVMARKIAKPWIDDYFDSLKKS